MHENRFFLELKEYIEIILPYQKRRFYYIIDELKKCKTSITVPFDCLMNEIVNKCNKIPNFTICELIMFIGNSFEYIWFFKYKQDDPYDYCDFQGANKIIHSFIRIFKLCFLDLYYLTDDPLLFIDKLINTLIKIRNNIELIYNIKPKKLTLDLYNNITNLKSFYNINIKLWYTEYYNLNQSKEDYLDNEFLNLIKEHKKIIKNKPKIVILPNIITYDYNRYYKKIKEYCLHKLENLLFIIDIFIDVYNNLLENQKKIFMNIIIEKIKLAKEEERIVKFNKL